MDFYKMTKEELIEYIKNLNENESGKYGLIWDKEKEPEQIVVDCDKYIPVLKGVKEKNIDNGGRENILIEGDNFHSLSVLNYTHKESIDVIYIDPPYNTGNKDFIYNDKYVDFEDGYRHSKWLNFMSKRLRLARELLKSDGVVFISIDDNEYAQLKLLCDRIFGDFNNLGTIIQNKGNAQNDATDIQKNHEYILVYRKEKRINNKKVVPTLKNIVKKEKVVLKDENGYYYKSGSIITGGEGGTLNHRPNLGYTIYYNPKTEDFIAIDDYDKDLAKTSNDERKIYTDNLEYLENGYEIIRPPKKGIYLGAWTWGLEKFNNEKRNILISKSKDKYLISKKQYINKDDIIDENGILKYYEYVNSNTRSIIDYSTSAGSIELMRILGESRKFNNPKNHEMIKYLISLHPNKNAIVLDFFAGSGTTAQAVLELNQEDGGNRQFILCTNNENEICENITYPRCKTIIIGKRSDGSKYSEGVNTSLVYYKTDFVDNNGTRDQLYYDLTEKCIPMLCVKGATFNKVEFNNEYAIFVNRDDTKYTCVYFDIFGLKYDEFINKIKNIKEEKLLYIFTLGDYVDTSNLMDVNNYTIEPIPYKIVELYKKIVKMSKED